MSRSQLIGAVGAFAALIALLVWFPLARSLLAGVPIPADDAADRLGYAVRWCLAPGLTLLIGVWAAARRGFLGDAIDGTRTPTNHGLEINLRYNQNTIEQVILAVIAWGGLALALPHGQLYLIPAMACAFVVGRATFWIGYLIHPMGRAFGMTLTILPTICACGWLVWRAVVG